MSEDGAGPSRIDYSDGVDISASHLATAGGFAAGSWLSVATGEISHPPRQAPVSRPAASKANNESSVWFYEEEEDDETEDNDEHSHSQHRTGDPPTPSRNAAAMQASGAAASPRLHQEPSQLAARRAAADAHSAAVLSRMYHDAMDRKLARQQWACLERAKLQVLEASRNPCTFKPKLSSYAKAIHRPKSLSPENRAQGEVRRKMEWRSARKAAAIEHDLAECTFKPLTLSAAKLHASALLHESHLFSKLHAHAAEVKVFKENVIEQAAQLLEDKMARKTGRAASTGGLTEEEVRDIVQRLVSGGAKLSIPAGTQPEFKPTLDANSQAIVEKRRLRSPETPQDVVERLLGQHQQNQPLRPSIARSDSADAESANDRGASAERHDPRIPALVELYRLLAEACIARVTGRSPGEIGAEQMAQLSLPASAIARAAVDILPVNDADELVAMMTGANVSDGTKLSSADFVQLTLREIRRTGPKQFIWSVQSEGRRRRSEVPNSSERNDKPTISKRSAELALARQRSVAASGVDIVERLQRQHELKQERQRHVAAAAEEEKMRRELAECTFRPQFTAYHPRPRPSSTAHNSSDDDDKIRDGARAAVLSPPSSDGNASTDNSGRVAQPSKLAEPARPSLHVRSASTGGVSSSVSPAIRRLSGSLSPIAAVGMSECAAFESPEALKQYGAELMRRQLEKKKKLSI